MVKVLTWEIKKDDAEAKIEYRGMTYYFCAAMCKDRFSRDPESFLTVIEIYTKEECHLCDEAKKVMERVKKEKAFVLKEVDITSDVTLYEKYKEQIPIVFINGKKAFKFKVDEVRLRRLLR